MKTAFISIAMILATVGCGSSSSSRRSGELYTGEEGGEAGQSVVASTGGSTGGAVASVGGSGGGVVQPTAGTGSVIDPTGGMGGEPVATGGNGGVCVPKTCLTFTVETTGSNELQACDLIEDGCGNYIDCGDCPANHQCGGGSLNLEDGIGALDDGIANICQGGCKYLAGSTCSDGLQQFGCAYPGTPTQDSVGQPLVDCYSAGSSLRWCCDYQM